MSADLHQRLRRNRVAGLLGGLVLSVLSLAAWFLVPLDTDTFPPSKYAAAWISLGMAIVGVVAVSVGVISTLRATSLEREHSELMPRGRLLDAFFPMFAAALAVTAQFGIWR